MGIPATVCNGFGTSDRMRVPAPAASTTRPTCLSCRGGMPTALVEVLSSSGGTRKLRGDAAGGPGFEPGTKVPKTLVIPFHHPPKERTDPTGTLTRGWCLPSPEGVYQRRTSVLATNSKSAPCGGNLSLPRGWLAPRIPLLSQRVLHPGEKRPLAVAARHLGVE